MARIGTTENDLLFADGYFSALGTGIESYGNNLYGGDGDDTLYGTEGDDILDGGYGFDFMDGGAGIDTVTYSFYFGGIIASLETGVVSFPGNSTLTDTLSGIENIIGSTGNDQLIGNAINNNLDGGDGDDILYGAEGDDILDGGYGFDFIDGGAGIDTVTYSFYFGGIIASLETGVVSFPGNSTLTDTLSDIENIIGSTGNDQLIGNEGDNLLNGGYGSDTLLGGTGADWFTFYSPTEGIDTIADFTWQQGDKLVVSASGFGGGLTIGDLALNQFTYGSAATTAEHRFIYNSFTGAMFFDSDGIGGATQVQFATLSPSLSLIGSDISVIA